MRALALISLYLIGNQALANFTATDTITVQRISQTIQIDGILSEQAWDVLSPVSRFIQREPLEGTTPSQTTLVYIGYDDNALYIGARLYDSAPDSIIARLDRRDRGFDSDMFGIFIDPYLDRRSGYYFGMNAAGTVFDGVLMNDDWDDDSWDGVWAGAVSIDEEGWSAEFQIPFSQLRFHPGEQYLWGINFRRDIKRHNETDYLVFTPKDESGFVSRFPVLHGVENIDATRKVEVLPYLRTKAEYLDVDAGDPFNDGSRYRPGFGGDIKLGIGNNLTLDATINPDFGQVEVDPAVVNLSDFETFFQEKRPFFIEGNSIFNFGYGGSRSNWGFNWGNPDFFYSRRIGRAPQGSTPDYEYGDFPESSRILSAAKLTGKIGENWNIGTIHALTNREYADLNSSGKTFEHEVEPLTYYGVLRAQKEIDQGRQGIGFIATLSNRFFKNDNLSDDLNKRAYTGGLDGWTFLDQDKMWVINGWFGMTHVLGSKQRMIDLQRSSRHYYQRPDAGHVRVDSNATHLTGYGGRITVNKQKGNIIFNSALGIIDPGFEVNDLGFSWRTDVINGHVGTGYKWTDPTSLSQYAQILGAVFASFDFDYNKIWSGIWLDAFIRFHNYYSIDLMFAYNPESVSNRLTRGGPLVKTPSGWESGFLFQTDDKRELVFRVSTNGYIRSAQDWNRSVEFETEWKPLSNFSISIEPGIEWDQEFTQWIDVFEDPTATQTYGNRYVFGEMHQTELSASIRMSWTFTPKLSLQLFVQPLLSTGDFKNYKELSEPGTYAFYEYEDVGSFISDGDRYIRVDPDGSGPAEEFEFEDPDFNIKSIRANMVLRWEYLPGSTLYVVWTQSRFETEQDGRFQFRDGIDRLFRASADNIFLVKLTYWLNI
jgi:hypothetical protein